jgi:hypothetical protein
MPRKLAVVAIVAIEPFEREEPAFRKTRQKRRAAMPLRQQETVSGRILGVCGIDLENPPVENGIDVGGGKHRAYMAAFPCANHPERVATDLPRQFQAFGFFGFSHVSIPFCALAGAILA